MTLTFSDRLSSPVWSIGFSAGSSEIESTGLGLSPTVLSIQRCLLWKQSYILIHEILNVCLKVYPFDILNFFMAV